MDIFFVVEIRTENWNVKYLIENEFGLQYMLYYTNIYKSKNNQILRLLLLSVLRSPNGKEQQYQHNDIIWSILI